MSPVWRYSAFILLNHLSPAKPLHHFKEKVGFVHVWFYFPKHSEYLSKEVSETKSTHGGRTSIAFWRLNFSREVKKWGRCSAKELPACSVPPPLLEAMRGHFHSENTDFATHFCSKREAHLPPSIHNTFFPHHLTLPALYSGAFPHSRLYVPSAGNKESAASNIRLELFTSWH